MMRPNPKSMQLLAGAGRTTRTSQLSQRARRNILALARTMSTFAHEGSLAPRAPVAALVQKKSIELNAPSLDTNGGYVKLPLFGDLSRTPGKLHASRTTLLNDGLPRTAAQLEVVREEILDYFHATFSLTEKLFDVFSTVPAFYRKHERLRHPPIFYVGHTATFYINKLRLGQFITERLDPVLEMQMAVGVDEMSWDDLDSARYVWPSYEEAEEDVLGATEFLQQVLNYRRDARELVQGLIRERPMEWPIQKDSFWYVILMCIEHDHIHLETSSCILRQAPIQFMQQSHHWPACTEGRFHLDPLSPVAEGTPKNRIMPVEAGVTRLGRSWERTKTYGWDNEFGKEQQVEVPAFGASEYMVSNKEFWGFVQAGGYKTAKYWTEEGWAWVSCMKPEQPLWWLKRDGGYFMRLISQEVPMAWDWPVECSHHEAAAFCKWLSEKTGKSLRLPLEDEFMLLRDGEPTDLQDSEHGPAWEVAPGNINLEHYASACPVDKFRSPTGFYDVLGNVWHHSLTMLDVLDGFASHPLYEDFTTPTVDSFHARIMGGSFMSRGASGGTRDSRFGFRRHFYQHAGFRYVESDRPVNLSVSPFEVRRELCNSFRFHFDKPFHTPFSKSDDKTYPERLAQVAFEALSSMGRSPHSSSAMELGCGPGRTVMELAKLGLFWVNGADLTAKFFNAASQQLIPRGKMRWTNYTEGEFVEKREVTIEELGIAKNNNLSIGWHQMPDFSAIDNKKFHNYDLVICAQPGALTASDPMGLLANVHTLVRPGGLFICGSQYDWVVSQKCGVLAEGLSSGAEVLAAVLGKWFDPVLEPQDLEFVKAETSRKFECGTQHLTFWQRRQDPRPHAIEPAIPSAKEGIVACPSSFDSIGQEMYDDDLVIGEYLEFHYGPNSTYPVTCAERCIEVMREVGQPMGKVLEVGGGPGRAAIELSKSFDHVHSGDYSSTFVDLANRLLTDGELKWQVLQDRTVGSVVHRSVNAKELGAGNISFSQVDAHNLPDEQFDLICGFNLIDRLEKPVDFLACVKARLNPGGVLVLSSPYTWVEEFTPKDNWLGGFKYGDNDASTTYEGMKEILLTKGFEEVKPPQEIWFRIDSLANGRMSQQTKAHMTFWRCIEM